MGRCSGFRPLAGFWFLNKSLCMHQQQESGSFRPLAGALYLSFPRRYGGSGEHSEPMGALVPCVHFCRYGWFTTCVHGAPSGTLRVPPPPLWQGRLEVRSVPLRGSPILASPVATGEVASNASRWGRLCLACTSVAMDGLRLAFMAPPPAHCVCHLPRSGRGGWRYAPSPCGVLVLKCRNSSGTNRRCSRFRPLAGFWFLNNNLPIRNVQYVNWFPSPCGVLVLKSSPCETLWCLDENAILRRGGVVGAKSSVRLFEKLLCPPSCLARRGFLSRA